MSVVNNWEITVKSKSGKRIINEIDIITGRIRRDGNLDYLFNDGFYPLHDSIYRVDFFTSWYDAENIITEFFREFTKEFSDIAVEIIQNYDRGSSYYRHIIADGDHEELNGYIDYPAPERLKYFEKGE